MKRISSSCLYFSNSHLHPPILLLLEPPSPLKVYTAQVVHTGGAWHIAQRPEQLPGGHNDPGSSTTPLRPCLCLSIQSDLLHRHRSTAGEFETYPRRLARHHPAPCPLLKPAVQRGILPFWAPRRHLFSAIPVLLLLITITIIRLPHRHPLATQQLGHHLRHDPVLDHPRPHTGRYQMFEYHCK